MSSEGDGDQKHSPTDDPGEHFEIQGKLQAAHRATLHMPDGTDIELDLEEQHQDGTAQYKVWGIEDTEPGDGERTYRNRLRLFCDARIIGHSDRNDDDSTFTATATLNLDTTAADESLDELQEKILEINRDLKRLDPGGRP